MLARAFFALGALAFSGCTTVSSAGAGLPLVGSWRLESRVDRTTDGRELIEPSEDRIENAHDCGVDITSGIGRSAHASSAV